MSFRKRHVLACAVPLLPHLAAAQTATPQAGAASSADAGEIIVTARRREETLRGVPISVSARGRAVHEQRLR